LIIDISNYLSIFAINVEDQEKIYGETQSVFIWFFFNYDIIRVSLAVTALSWRRKHLEIAKLIWKVV